MRERVDGCQVAWIEACHRQGSVIVLDGADPILESNAFWHHPDNVAGQSYRLRLEADEVSPKVSGFCDRHIDGHDDIPFQEKIYRASRFTSFHVFPGTGDLVWSCVTEVTEHVEQVVICMHNESGLMVASLQWAELFSVQTLARTACNVNDALKKEKSPLT